MGVEDVLYAVDIREFRHICQNPGEDVGAAGIEKCHFLTVYHKVLIGLHDAFVFVLFPPQQGIAVPGAVEKRNGIKRCRQVLLASFLDLLKNVPLTVNTRPEGVRFVEMFSIL